jgi:hypothetical protein
MKDVLFALGYHGMPSVGPALIADYDVGPAGEGVHHPSLAFVPPLRSYKHLHSVSHSVSPFAYPGRSPDVTNLTPGLRVPPLKSLVNSSGHAAVP